MSDITSTDFIGDTAVCGVFRAKVALFLDDDDDAVTYSQISEAGNMMEVVDGECTHQW